MRAAIAIGALVAVAMVAALYVAIARNVIAPAWEPRATLAGVTCGRWTAQFGEKRDFGFADPGERSMSNVWWCERHLNFRLFDEPLSTRKRKDWPR